MRRPPGHHGVERGTELPWPLPSSSPNPQPQALLPNPAVQEELIQGRRKAPSQDTSFSLSGALPGGISWAEAGDRERKEER